MRRALLTLALLTAAAAPAAFGAAPLASVRVVKCSIEEREAAFQARMKAIEGTDRMAMRFTLLERTDVQGYRRLKAPALRRWRWSKPGVQVFGYRQAVRNLPEHASHRMRVDFRWYASDGERIARVKRTSAPCRQFTALPNLTASIVGITPTDNEGVQRYLVLLGNTGEVDVSDVSLRLSVDGAVVDTKPVASPEAGESRSVPMRGPACGRRAAIEVDPDKLIAETSEDDNVHELSCS